jgi:hypothetical protein
MKRVYHIHYQSHFLSTSLYAKTVGIEWSSFLLFIQEVMISNLIPGTGYPK